MKYNELKLDQHRRAKRVGRGIAGGQGKTAGRGTKGQNSRTGSKKRPGFAGGQNPLMQQLPKLPGFKSKQVKAEIIYTDELVKISSKEVDADSLFDAKLIANKYGKVKLLFRGDVSKKATVKIQAASQTAIESLQKAGGSFEKVPQVKRPKTSTKKSDTTK
jgi:large subunit ribosomal protein L15